MISLGVAKSPEFAQTSRIIDELGRIQSRGQLQKMGSSECAILRQVIICAASSVRWFIGRYFNRFFFSGASLGGELVKIGPGKYLFRSNLSLWLSQQNSVVKASATHREVRYNSESASPNWK